MRSRIILYICRVDIDGSVAQLCGLTSWVIGCDQKVDENRNNSVSALLSWHMNLKWYTILGSYAYGISIDWGSSVSTLKPINSYTISANESPFSQRVGADCRSCLLFPLWNLVSIARVRLMMLEVGLSVFWFFDSWLFFCERFLNFKLKLFPTNCYKTSSHLLRRRKFRLLQNPAGTVFFFGIKESATLPVIYKFNQWHGLPMIFCVLSNYFWSKSKALNKVCCQAISLGSLDLEIKYM